MRDSTSPSTLTLPSSRSQFATAESIPYSNRAADPCQVSSARSRCSPAETVQRGSAALAVIPTTHWKRLEISAWERPGPSPSAPFVGRASLSQPVYTTPRGDSVGCAQGADAAREREPRQAAGDLHTTGAQQLPHPGLFPGRLRPPALGHVAAPGRQLQPARLLLVDGSALLFLAYYKVQARLIKGASSGREWQWEKHGNAQDEDVGATIFGTIEAVLTLLETQPTHAAVVFDYPGPTFRDELYGAYKHRRGPKPDGVVLALRGVMSALMAMGLRVFQVPSVEADDVIATVAHEAVSQGMQVRVASPDKDFFQLLGPHLSLLRPVPGGWWKFVEFGEGEFRERYRGLQPCQFVDVMALAGDRSDDVPGARGIGEKTAPKLVQKYGSVSAVVEGAHTIPQKRIREAILSSQDMIMLSRQLIELKADVEWGATVDCLQLRPLRDEGGAFWDLMTALEDRYCVPLMSGVRQRILALWGHPKPPRELPSVPMVNAPAWLTHE